MLQNPGATVAAVIIHPLIARMGWGWCFTGLSILSLVGVGTAVIVLCTKSPHWRKKKAAKMTAK
jgi:sugar phosphate permease